MYKRFIIFEYDCHYPSGGCRDITVSFDSLEECKNYLNEKYIKNESIRERKVTKNKIKYLRIIKQICYSGPDYAEIFDCVERDFIDASKPSDIELIISEVKI